MWDCKEELSSRRYLSIKTCLSTVMNPDDDFPETPLSALGQGGGEGCYCEGCSKREFSKDFPLILTYTESYMFLWQQKYDASQSQNTSGCTSETFQVLLQMGLKIRQWRTLLLAEIYLLWRVLKRIMPWGLLGMHMSPGEQWSTGMTDIPTACYMQLI